MRLCGQIWIQQFNHRTSESLKSHCDVTKAHWRQLSEKCATTYWMLRLRIKCKCDLYWWKTRMQRDHFAEGYPCDSGIIITSYYILHALFTTIAGLWHVHCTQTRQVYGYNHHEQEMLYPVAGLMVTKADSVWMYDDVLAYTVYCKCTVLYPCRYRSVCRRLHVLLYPHRFTVTALCYANVGLQLNLHALFFTQVGTWGTDLW